MNENQRHFLLIPIVICLVFISVLIISLIPGEYPLVSAIPNDAGNSIDFTYITPINYSLIPTVNNSDYLDGYDSSYFYPASNPDGFINGESDTLQSVTDRGNVTTNLINLSGGLRTNKIIPLADSTTAMQFLKADGTTNVLNVDTTNGNLNLVSSTNRKGLTIKNTNSPEPTFAGQIYTGTDSSNYAASAMYITPSSSSRRLFIGGAGGGTWYSVNWAGVSLFESLPSLILSKTNVLEWGTAGYGGNTKISSDTSNTMFLQSYDDAQYGKFVFKGAVTGNTYMVLYLTPNQAYTGDMSLGMGTTTPSARLHIIKTTEQLRLGYNASNYLSATVGSTGSATFNLTGTSPQFNYLNNVNVTGNITASQNYFVGSSKGLTASYNCTSFPNVTITGGIITSFSC